MNGLVGGFAIIVGLLMGGFWASLLLRGKAELRERPWDMGFHLVAEFATAALLVTAGVGTLAGSTWSGAVMPATLGMLLYSVLNSPGFYAGRRQWPMAGMFVALAVLTAAALVVWAVST